MAATIVLSSLLLLLAVLSLNVARAVYRVFFHPLAQFPGPKLAAISELWWVRNWFSGRSAMNIGEVHRRYGDVVRVAPNQLSFNTPTAAKDIYYHVINGRPKLLKSNDYVRPEIQSVATVQDPDIHRHLRYHLSHAFSLRAVRRREGSVIHYADRFVEKLQALGIGEHGINVIEAYNWVAFDVMGEFAFSKDLGALSGNTFTQSWIASILDGTLWGVVPMLLKRVPLSRFVFSRYLPKNAASKRVAHRDRVRRLVRERTQEKPATIVDNPGERDILNAMLTDPHITEDRTVSGCMLLLAAGSGNIQSTLSSATFYLLTNPKALRKLQVEIRSCFKHSSDINDTQAGQLPYLSAVIEEALRLFPPIPSQLPRTSPGTLIDNTYVPAGTTVASASYSMSRDPRYWSDPDEFHPERWLRGEHAELRYNKDCQQAALPWSLGPRVCLGINVSYLVIRVILAKVIFNFDLELLPQSRQWEENLKIIFLWRKPELRVRFIRRPQSQELSALS